jgi:hypothetical protein
VFGSVSGREVPVGGKIWDKSLSKAQQLTIVDRRLLFKNTQIFSTHNYSLEKIAGIPYSYLVVTNFVDSIKTFLIYM